MADYRDVDFEKLYAPHDLVELDEPSLRKAFEGLPCCTANEGGSRSGDPLNLVLIGSMENIAAGFARRGWFPTEEIYSKTVWKTIKSFLQDVSFDGFALGVNFPF